VTFKARFITGRALLGPAIFTRRKQQLASLFKKTTTVIDKSSGEKNKRKSQKWWGKFRTANGQVKRVPLVADKTAALAMLNELVRKEERKLAGIQTLLKNTVRVRCYVLCAVARGLGRMTTRIARRALVHT
jgi:hypothetical protein